MDYFLDTNILIHYKFLDEIDWVNELEDTKINLIICSTVLSELEKKKLYDADLNVRNRCKTIISKLSQILDRENREIRKNTNIIFITYEPKLDWDNYQLVKEISDDRILATILNYNKNAILVTHDLGLKLKANGLRVATKSLNGSLFVELKKDKKDERINQLEAELLRLKNINPKLLLQFKCDNQYTNKCCLTKRKEVLYDHQQTQEIIKEQRNLYEYKKPRPNASSLMQNSFGDYLSTIQDNEINRYENEVYTYLQKLEVFYKKQWEFDETIKNIFCINLILINEGTAPGISIDVFLHFPDGLKILSGTDFPNKPQKPEVPDGPFTVSEIAYRERMSILKSINVLPNFSNSVLDYIKPENNQIIKKINGHDVHYKIEELKHTLSLPLGSLFFLFNNREVIKSFSFSYKIITNNYHEPFEDKLHIIFSSDNNTNKGKV
jgi:rRNA-processing protein FCF1